MDVIRKPEKIDPSRFAKPEDKLEIKYGLPRAAALCGRCVMSNQKPVSAIEFKHTADGEKSPINFDAEGICDACRVTEAKRREIDWEERERNLVTLCDQYRSRSSQYDCVVPGSGGKDSFFAAHVLKYKYGMRPLTVTWAPHIYTDWGWRNFQKWIHAGFDNSLFTPNGRVHRLLTRLATEILFHPFQPFILGQKNLAPKMSILHKIPLVFFGENEAEYGNAKADADKPVRDWRYFMSIDQSESFLGGVSITDLKDRFGLDDTDLEPYLPADPDLIEKVGTEVHYLGYYLKWHPQGCYYYAQEHGGFEASPERTPGTYSKYNSIDDKIDDFHYLTSYVKFGVGRAMCDAAQEIRSGDIMRDEGIALIRRYDGEFPERFAEEVFEYLSIPAEDYPTASKMFEQPIMDRDYFMDLSDSFRSPHLWKYEDGAWQLRHSIE